MELLFVDDFALLDGESSDEEAIGMQEYLGDDAVLPEDMADLRRTVEVVEVGDGDSEGDQFQGKYSRY